MPNWVTNKIYYEGDYKVINKMLDAIKNDVCGRNTIDFLKVIPRPYQLDIEAGSSTYRGMKQVEEYMNWYKNEYITPTQGKVNTYEELIQLEKEAEKIYLGRNTNIDPEDWELGKKAQINIEKYGAPTWYEWCIRNWGCKWNACGYDDEYDYTQDECMTFDTAWSPPHQILEKLAADYPEITFVHEWADEDLGQNCGSCKYVNGKRVKAYIPITNEEGLRFACKVQGYDYDEIKAERDSYDDD